MQLSTIITRALVPVALQLVVVCMAAHAQYEGGSWRPAAGPYGGKITALVAATDGSIIAGTPAGIYRSTSSGASWSLQSSELGILPVNGLARDSAGRLWAATSPYVYRSDDNGVSWMQLDQEYYVMTAITTINGTDVLASRQKGIRRWRHDLSYWTGGAPYSNLKATTVITALGAQQGIIYVGTSDDGLYRSDDGGNSIQRVEGFPCSAAVYSIDMRTVDSGGVALAVGTSCGLFRWISSAPVWAELSGPLSGRPVATVKLIGNALYAGTNGFGIFRTFDGLSWTEVYNGMENATINAVEGMPNGTIYCGTMHGVQRSDNQGERWESVSNGIRATVIRGLIVDRQGYLFACTPSGVYRSMDKGANWQEKNYLLADRDVQCFALDPDGSLWAATRHGRLFHSADKGDSWEEREFASNSPVEAIEFDSQGRMMVGTSGEQGRLYTLMESQQWRVSQIGEVKALERNGSILYALTSNYGLYHSLDLGENWINLRNVRGYGALDINPAGYVLMGGPTYVDFSKTAGETWGSLSPSPYTPYRAVLIDADDNMLIGTGRGPDRSIDKGGHWTSYWEGLRAPITAFAQYADRTLVAGTDGAGIYLRDYISASTPPYASTTEAFAPAIQATAGGIILDVVQPGRYAMTLHDALGRQLALVADTEFDIGSHLIEYSFDGLALGVYLVQVRGGGSVVTTKVVVEW